MSERERYFDEMRRRLHLLPAEDVAKTCAEMEAHLDAAIEDALAVGVAPGDAEAQALKAMGDVRTIAKEVVRRHPAAHKMSGWLIAALTFHQVWWVVPAVAQSKFHLMIGATSDLFFCLVLTVVALAAFTSKTPQWHTVLKVKFPLALAMYLVAIALYSPSPSVRSQIAINFKKEVADMQRAQAAFQEGPAAAKRAGYAIAGGWKLPWEPARPVSSFDSLKMWAGNDMMTYAHEPPRIYPTFEAARAALDKAVKERTQMLRSAMFSGDRSGMGWVWFFLVNIFSFRFLLRIGFLVAYVTLFQRMGDLVRQRRHRRPGEMQPA